MITQIKTITPKTFQGKVTGYAVELVDGIVGNLSDKASDKDLKAGESVDYIIQDYVSKAGKHSNLLTIKRSIGQPPVNIPKADNLPTNLPNNPPPPKLSQSKDELKTKVPFIAGEKMIELITSGKVKWEEFQKYYKELCDYFYAEIDRCPISPA